ncbi:TIGR03915 family putative DNA repair protein [Clostridium sp.]|uniref:TIGR03915 family putative DNA repair protein n=1 Tax=Clostridium sp. TaxID=1506 RepID=UPI0026364AA5|nr:TIGR03915 family putative DNA repair protein [Clostridium sp.]
MLTLIYENTFEGFLTAIYYAFYSKEDVYSIITKEEVSFNLLAEIKDIKSEDDKYKKVKTSIVSKIDPLSLNKIYKLFLSNEKDKGLLCYNYLKKAFKFGSKIHEHIYLNEVRNLDLICRRVSLESHRFTGFIRFKSIQNNFLYAVIEPDNNILELISPHFQRRFSNEYWIIHDKKRNIASVYNKVSWEIHEMDSSLLNIIDTYEDNFEDLWKGYFKSTTIIERTNLKLQKRQMPKRYWDNLTETKK